MDISRKPGRMSRIFFEHIDKLLMTYYTVHHRRIPFVVYGSISHVPLAHEINRIPPTTAGKQILVVRQKVDTLVTRAEEGRSRWRNMSGRCQTTRDPTVSEWGNPRVCKHSALALSASR